MGAIELFPTQKFQDVGTWQAFTPVWIQAAATISWTGTCHYTQTGKTVTAWYDLTATSAGSAGGGVAVSLPLPSSVPGSSGSIVPIGAGFATVSTGQVPIVPLLNHNGTISFTRDDVLVTNYFGADPSFTIASGNKLGFFITYEADTPSTAYAGATLSNRVICTSTTRPTGVNVWPGLEIFETDTGGEATYSASSTWVYTAWTGALLTSVPTLAQGASTNIAKTSTVSEYCVVNGVCEWWFKIDPTAAGTSGSAITLSLPVAAVAAGSRIAGAGMYFDASGPTEYGVVYSLETTGAVSMIPASGGSNNFLGAVPAFAVASSDSMRGHLRYRVI